MQSWGPLPFGGFQKAIPAGEERHRVSLLLALARIWGVSYALPSSCPLETEQSEASSLYRNILATAEVVEKRASIVSLILLSICFTYSRNWNGLIGLLPLSSLTCHEIFPREMVGEVKNKWTLHSTTALSCAVLKLRQRHRATESRRSTFSRGASQTYEEGAAAQHSRPLRLLFIKTILCYSLKFK